MPPFYYILKLLNRYWNLPVRYYTFSSNSFILLNALVCSGSWRKVIVKLGFFYYLRGGGTVVITTRDLSLLTPVDAPAAGGHGGAPAGAQKAAFLACLGGHPDQIHMLYLDLSSLASVRDLAAQLSARFPSIDCLVCNAGVMAANCSQLTSEGYELHFGVNHLGKGRSYEKNMLLP